MRQFVSSLKKDKLFLPQLFFVFAAFFIMIIIGSLFGSRIIDRNVEAYGNAVVNTAGETIGAYLDEYNLILNDVTFSLTQLAQQGADTEDMLVSIIAWTQRLMESDQRYKEFSGFYGVLEGQFVDGTGWDPISPESEDYNPDYIAQDRPWYIGAVNANGETHITDPYIDADTGEFVMSLSKMIFLSGGRFVGIIAMDLFLTDVVEIVNSLSLLDSGYGVLLDSERKIVVTYHQDRVGAYFDDIDDGHAEIGAALDAYGNTVHRQIESDGEEYVAFFKQIPNGWYVGVASLRENYYSDSRQMTLVLSVVGLLLALPLCGVLIYLHIRRLRADEASNLKTSFLANMSHEIRTPMNAIIGMTELLQNEQLSEQQEGYVKDINSSAGTLLSIINDILDLSKIEAGKIELRPIDYEFPAFLDNIVSMFNFVACDKGLEFRFQKTGQLPECLYGDDLRLRQVLTNLCGNAAKFTNEGYISLSVTVKDSEIIFEIKDTGLGIRKDDLPKLFNPFEQFDMQSNRKIIGTGLGLPISKNFVEMMGGSISVESIFGSGTTFTVKIPKIPGNIENVLSAKIPEELKVFIAPEALVLVVDDNEVNLKVATGLLRNLYKIEAETAASGKDAISLIKNNDYDIIFMDHMMPEMDGVQTVGEIRKLGGKYKSIKILALTANAVTGVKEMFLRSGFDGFLSKPIDTGELNEVLLSALPRDKIVTVDKASSAAISAGSNSDLFQQAISAAKNVVFSSSDKDIPLSVSNDAFMSALSGIAAINVEIALSRVSGLEDMLKETLELFFRKLPEEYNRLNDFNKHTDIDNFAISVHGLKSALSSIGATELSDTAFELEKAAKSGDTEYCIVNLPRFLSNLNFLQEQLAELFHNEAENQAEQAAGNISLFTENVHAAIEACENFDDTAALEAVKTLLIYDFGPEINAHLRNAKSAIEDFNYDAAIDALSMALEVA